MSKRPVELLLEDILEAITKIERYTQDVTFEAFLQDDKTTDAVVRNLEIIGEAANRLPAEFRKRYALIDWHGIVGLRHRIVHDYFGVDLEMIWHIVKNDLMKFKTEINRGSTSNELSGKSDG